MYIRIYRRINLRNAVDNRARLLRRCRIVKIDKRTVIDFARENREIGPDLFYIVHFHNVDCTNLFYKPRRQHNDSILPEDALRQANEDDRGWKES